MCTKLIVNIADEMSGKRQMTFDLSDLLDRSDLDIQDGWLKTARRWCVPSLKLIGQTDLEKKFRNLLMKFDLSYLFDRSDLDIQDSHLAINRALLP